MMAHQPIENRSALVLYGSETGNAQDVAEELGRLAERLRFTVRVSQLDDVRLVRALTVTMLDFLNMNRKT